jgi:hypothetical protein
MAVGQPGTGASHASEIPFLFHVLGGTDPKYKMAGPAEIQLSTLLLRYWANFAANGDPNKDYNGRETAYEEIEPPYTWEGPLNDTAVDCKGETDCLSPSSLYGCTGEFSGQCTWGSPEVAKNECGKWPACKAFFCSDSAAPGVTKRLCFGRANTVIESGYSTADQAWRKVHSPTPAPPPSPPPAPSPLPPLPFWPAFDPATEATMMLDVFNTSMTGSHVKYCFAKPMCSEIWDRYPAKYTPQD